VACKKSALPPFKVHTFAVFESYYTVCGALTLMDSDRNGI